MSDTISIWTNKHLISSDKQNILENNVNIPFPFISADLSSTSVLEIIKDLENKEAISISGFTNISYNVNSTNNNVENINSLIKLISNSISNDLTFLNDTRLILSKLFHSDGSLYILQKYKGLNNMFICISEPYEITRYFILKKKMLKISIIGIEFSIASY